MLFKNLFALCAAAATAVAEATTFRLKIDDQYGVVYLYTEPGRTNVLFTSDIAKAQVFELRDGGAVWAGERFLGRYSSKGVQYARVFDVQTPANPAFVPFECTIDARSLFDCTIPGNPAHYWGTQLYKDAKLEWRRSDGASVYHASPEEYRATTTTWSFDYLVAIPAE